MSKNMARVLNVSSHKKRTLNLPAYIFVNRASLNCMQDFS